MGYEPRNLHRVRPRVAVDPNTAQRLADVEARLTEAEDSLVVLTHMVTVSLQQLDEIIGVLNGEEPEFSEFDQQRDDPDQLADLNDVEARQAVIDDLDAGEETVEEEAARLRREAAEAFEKENADAGT